MQPTTSLRNTGTANALLLRSLLFVPGDSERKLKKAQSVGADALVIDLEDAVVSASKPRARELAADFLGDRDRARARTLWVRVNALGEPWFADDVAAAVQAGADGIVLPKPHSVADVVELGRRLDTLETRLGLAAGATKVIALATETPASLFALGDYARAAPRLAALSWGAEDLSAALGAATAVDEHGGWLPPYELARSLCLLASGAAAVPAVDTVYTAVADLDGLERAAATARRDGFAGKLAIHPDQVEILNRIFAPTRADVVAANAVVAAFAAAGGAGVIVHEGRMLDRPHLTRAERVLALAAAVDPTATSEQRTSGSETWRS
jgi:citrate lyase subunit beta/citryl-CoA lyase